MDIGTAQRLDELMNQVMVLKKRIEELDIGASDKDMWSILDGYVCVLNDLGVLIPSEDTQLVDALRDRVKTRTGKPSTYLHVLGIETNQLLDLYALVLENSNMHLNFIKGNVH